MKTFRYIPFAALLVVVLLSSCGGTTPEAEAEAHHDEESDIVELTDAQFTTVGIETGHVEMRTISGTISATGELDVPPQSKVSVSAPMGGFVKSTDLLEGTRVEKGQVVAALEHQDYIQLQQDYLDNNSQLKFLKGEYERQQELAKASINSGKSLEQAEADYNSKKAVVDGLKAKLQMINISVASLEKGQIQNSINLYSPISGYVTKVNTNIGAYVAASTVMFEIVNTEHLHAELTIFEKDVPRLKIGQRVLFTLANETTQRAAFVHLIGREIGHDRSVQVHCHIEKEDRELIPGMYLQAIVETDSAHVTALPEDAVVDFGGKKYIYVETEHTDDDHAEEAGVHHYRMVEVTTGESELGYVHVYLPQDVNDKTSIVTKGAFSLLAKMKNSEEEGHAH